MKNFMKFGKTMGVLASFAGIAGAIQACGSGASASGVAAVSSGVVCNTINGAQVCSAATGVVPASAKASFYVAACEEGYVSPYIEINNRSIDSSGICKVTATLVPISNGSTSIPFLGPEAINAPIDSEITLWANDTATISQLQGEWSTSYNTIQFSWNGNSSACSNAQNISSANGGEGALYGELSSQLAPIAINNGTTFTVPTDGDLLIGVNIPPSSEACIENLDFSVQVTRCVDVNGNTYPTC